MKGRGSSGIAMRLACHVVWLEGGERHAMLTENMSRDGMLLRWEESSGRLPAVGQMLIVEVDLPERAGLDRGCIRCQTVVARVRAERDTVFTWVGLRIHDLDFRMAQRVSAHREPAIYNGRGSRMF